MMRDAEKDRYIQLLGQRIRDLRVKHGYTSYETFSFEKDIPRAQFGRYERGTDIRFLSLIKVVKAFDMTLGEFFSEGFEELKD